MSSEPSEIQKAWSEYVAEMRSRGNAMPNATDETYEFFTPGFECGFERGIKAVTVIRCTKHHAEPQLNKAECTGAECAICAIDSATASLRTRLAEVEKERDGLRSSLEDHKNEISRLKFECAKAGVGDFTGDYFMGEITTSGLLRSQLATAQRELEAMRKWVEALREQLKEVFAELTDVQQENIFDGIPPSVAITHHFRRVQQSLKLKLEDFLPAVGAATESGEGAPDHV